mmetsp:Transcript_39063/g.57001  ORF Transcript_39063/g.57001 Transcript_39063/m.57001 type:complete len:133 (-) Transcript_39063:787-1185(-)
MSPSVGGQAPQSVAHDEQVSPYSESQLPSPQQEPQSSEQSLQFSPAEPSQYPSPHTEGHTPQSEGHESHASAMEQMPSPHSSTQELQSSTHVLQSSPTSAVQIPSPQDGSGPSPPPMLLAQVSSISASVAYG